MTPAAPELAVLFQLRSRRTGAQRCKVHDSAGDKKESRCPGASVEAGVLHPLGWASHAHVTHGTSVTCKIFFQPIARYRNETSPFEPDSDQSAHSPNPVGVCVAHPRRNTDALARRPTASINAQSIGHSPPRWLG